MLTSSQIDLQASEIGKSLSKARRMLELAYQRTDPTANAELMHSWQQAREEMENAAYHLSQIHIQPIVEMAQNVARTSEKEGA